MPDSPRNYLRPDVLAGIGGLEMRARTVVEGIISGMHRSPYQGFSVEFAQHREYVPGDDLRHLDWRVYGKSDRFYIKQYEEETNLRAHLLVDCSASMRYPEQDAAQGRMTKFDYAATLAACLAYLLVHQGDAVGLMLFDDEVRTAMPALSNFAHMQSIVGQLEQARLERPTEARAVFGRLAAQLHRRGLVVLVSDLLGDREEIIRGVERLQQGRHEVIVMHVLDEDERRFPFMDHTLFEGLENVDQRLLADPQSLRTAYLEALAEFVADLRTAFVNRRIDFVELSTADPLDVALRAYLARREHLIKARA